MSLETDFDAVQRLKPLIREITSDGLDHICYRADGFCLLLENGDERKNAQKSQALVWNNKRFRNLAKILNADVIHFLPKGLQ